MSYFVFTDGASRGNPGKAAIGCVCFKDRVPALSEFKESAQSVFQVSEVIGIKTNNEAEYMSLISALKKLKENDINKAQIFMDSELVVRQINGIYKVKKDTLQKLWIVVKDLAKNSDYVFKHVPREKNQIADYLANMALDNKSEKNI